METYKPIDPANPVFKSTGDEEKDERIRELFAQLAEIGKVSQNSDGRFRLEINSGHYDYYDSHPFENPYERVTTSYKKMRDELRGTVELFFPIRWVSGDTAYSIELDRYDLGKPDNPADDSLRNGTTWCDRLSAGFIVTGKKINGPEKGRSEIVCSTVNDIPLLDIPLMTGKGLFIIAGKERSISAKECDGTFALPDMFRESFKARNSAYVRDAGDRILDRIKECLATATEAIHAELVNESESGIPVTGNSILNKLNVILRRELLGEMRSFFGDSRVCDLANTINETATMQAAVKVQRDILSEVPPERTQLSETIAEKAGIAGHANYLNDPAVHMFPVYNIPAGAEGAKQSERKYLNMGATTIGHDVRFVPFEVDPEAKDKSQSRLFIAEEDLERMDFNPDTDLIAFAPGSKSISIIRPGSDRSKFQQLFRRDPSHKIHVEHRRRLGARCHLITNGHVDTSLASHLDTDTLFYSRVVYPDEVNPDGSFKKTESGLVRAMHKGRVVLVPPDEVDYCFASCYQDTTYALGRYLTTFANHTRGTQTGKSANQASKALAPLAENISQNDVTVIKDPLEESFRTFACSDVKAVEAGTVREIGMNRIVIEDTEGTDRVYALGNDVCHNDDSWCGHRPAVAVGDKVTPGQNIALGPSSDNIGFTAAIMPFYGLNTDDATVISATAAKKMRSRHTKQFSVSVAINSLGDEKGTHYIGTIPEELKGIVPEEKIAALKENHGLAKPGDRVRIGSPLAVIARPSLRNSKPGTASNDPVNYVDGSLCFELKNIRETESADHDIDGTVTGVVTKTDRDKGITTHTFTVEYERPLTNSDKIVDLYGNKKLVRILPDEKMPVIKSTGQCVDMVLAPASNISRNNAASLQKGETERLIALCRDELGIDFAQVVIPRYADEDNIGYFRLAMKCALDKMHTGETLTLADGNGGRFSVYDINVIKTDFVRLTIHAADMMSQTYINSRDGESLSPANFSGMGAAAGIGSAVTVNALNALREQSINRRKLDKAVSEYQYKILASGKFDGMLDAGEGCVQSEMGKIDSAIAEGDRLATAVATHGASGTRSPIPALKKHTSVARGK